MKYRNDPDGGRLPIKVDTTSNGEFEPVPLEDHSLHANHLAFEQATENAKKTGVSRRSFLTSTCGAAGTLLAFNQAHAAAGKRGGYYDIPLQASLDTEVAADTLKQREFIFDIQGHHVNPETNWRASTTRVWEGLRYMPQSNCTYIDAESEFGYLECFTGKAFVKEMFLDSDTDMAVLTFSPSTYGDMPLTIDEAAATRELTDAMEGSNRLLIHGRVVPLHDGDIDRMTEMADEWDVSAWKTYTQYQEGETEGWWLDDEKYGAPLIAKARETGVNVICVHKGLPLPTPSMTKQNRHYGSCRDIGAAAKANPDINFIVYHSGFDTKLPEGPYQSGQHDLGIDSLIQSLIENDIKPNSNVYAELGTTWRYLMRDPDQAAHSLGKLLRYVGENNILWGTDSIWYGSPQDQIQAFRTFQISEEYREKFDYQEITPDIRAKIFGLNSAVPYKIDQTEIALHFKTDEMSKARANYANAIDPTYMTYGPRNRREFLSLLKMTGVT